MRKSDLEEQVNGEKIVKCACGLPMRQKNWSDHWRSCKVGSSVPVTEKDVDDLLSQEFRLRDEAREHEQWLKDRVKQVDAARSDGRVSW